MCMYGGAEMRPTVGGWFGDASLTLVRVGIIDRAEARCVCCFAWRRAEAAHTTNPKQNARRRVEE